MSQRANASKNFPRKWWTSQGSIDFRLNRETDRLSRTLQREGSHVWRRRWWEEPLDAGGSHSPGVGAETQRCDHRCTFTLIHTAPTIWASLVVRQIPRRAVELRVWSLCSEEATADGGAGALDIRCRVRREKKVSKGPKLLAWEAKPASGRGTASGTRTEGRTVWADEVRSETWPEISEREAEQGKKINKEINNSNNRQTLTHISRSHSGCEGGGALVSAVPETGSRRRHGSGQMFWLACILF